MKSKEEILKGYPWHGFEYSITREDALKAMQDYADQYATQLKEENARLRGLIESNYVGWFRAFYRATSTMTARQISEYETEQWQKFKTDNNLL